MGRRARPRARPRVRCIRRRENMVGVNMVGVHMAFHDAIFECFEGTMLEPCLLKAYFHVAGAWFIGWSKVSSTTCLLKVHLKRKK